MLGSVDRAMPGNEGEKRDSQIFHYFWTLRGITKVLLKEKVYGLCLKVVTGESILYCVPFFSATQQLLEYFWHSNGYVLLGLVFYKLGFNVFSYQWKIFHFWLGCLNLEAGCSKEAGQNTSLSGQVVLHGDFSHNDGNFPGEYLAVQCKSEGTAVL